MKLIKLALISIVALFMIITAISALLPSHVRISRAVTITALPARVNAALHDCNRWEQWNEYTRMSPKLSMNKDSIRTQDFTVTITRAGETTTSTFWRQKNGKSFPGVFSLTGQGAYTIVQWYFDFHFRWYPWEKFSSMVYDKQLGPAMEQSLTNLKQLAEKAE